jgi:hypothetical protein
MPSAIMQAVFSRSIRGLRGSCLGRHASDTFQRLWQNTSRRCPWRGHGSNVGDRVAHDSLLEKGGTLATTMTNQETKKPP